MVTSAVGSELSTTENCAVPPIVDDVPFCQRAVSQAFEISLVASPPLFWELLGVERNRSSNSTGISLDQLIALNDEIAALVRAGIPLELGLKHIGGDMPGRPGTLAATLSAEMERGQTLLEVLKCHPESFPPIYRAVVTAGVRVGNLSAALEAVTGCARRLSEIRQLVVASSIYPLIVFMLAWGLFLFFLKKITPVFLSAFQDFDTPGTSLLEQFVRLGDSMHYWGPAVPAVVILLGLIWFRGTSRANLIGSRSMDCLLTCVPFLGAMLRSFRIAAFTDVLTLLASHGVPLDEAVLLAAQSVGDRRMMDTSKNVAQAIGRGEQFSLRSAGNSPFPPFLDWLIQSGQQRGALLPALRHASDSYYRRAFRQASAARILLPTAMVAIVGGGVTLAYALMLFGPWVSLLHSLGKP